MAWPPSRDDLLALGGLPADAYTPDAREVEAVHVAEQLLELPGHGLSGARVRFTGGPGAVLAPPLSSLSWVNVAATDDPDFFALVGVTLTGAGSGKLYVREDFSPKLDRMRVHRASWIEARATAYGAPWVSAPEWACGACCVLVAFDAATALRLPSSRYPIDDVRKRHDEVQIFLRDELAKGVPMAVGARPVDATPSSPEVGARAVPLATAGDFDLPGGLV